MNLESVRQRNRAVTRDTDLHGDTIYIRKIGAADGVRLIKTIGNALTKNLEGEADHDATIAYHAEVISKSLANENGDLEFDTDEGRAELRATPLDQLQWLFDLGERCLKHSGLTAEAQKKS